jgi:hypothetical protein
MRRLSSLCKELEVLKLTVALAETSSVQVCLQYRTRAAEVMRAQLAAEQADDSCGG